MLFNERIGERMVCDVLELTIPMVEGLSLDTGEICSSSDSVAPSSGTGLDDRTERLVTSGFLATTSQSVLDGIVSRFIDTTSNGALKIVVCGSCAREMGIDECQEMPLKDIPNKHLLIPYVPHVAHELVDGLLLYGPTIGLADGMIQLCDGCRGQLKKNLRPCLSLGNGMWVGETPRQLQNLTLPERLLLAKYYPSAYIIKLFPKQKNASTWDRSQLHSGMRGNVSTYRLDPRQVAHLIDGTTFPPPASILSATIGITFVGPKGLRESSMPAMFRVRRWRVREALKWLKANNPLYSDIEISERTLMELPDDGVPDELMMTAKHSTDLKALERESENYVPTDAADEGSEGSYSSKKTQRKTNKTYKKESRQALFSEAGLVELVEEEEDIGHGNASSNM